MSLINRDGNMHIEPKIQIGHHVLSEAQAIAVRVAVTDFFGQVSTDEGRAGLGPIADAYEARLGEVLKIIMDEGSRS